MPIDLKRLRFQYATKLARSSNIKSRHLISAFAKIPREQFLGPSPWKIRPDKRGSRSAFTDDIADLYQDATVAINVKKGINNGAPGVISRWMDELQIKRGNTVYQVGVGTGYYTAILAETVGPQGRVIAIEREKNLYLAAKSNLSEINNIKLLHGDGTKFNPGKVDRIFLHAGVTGPKPIWLKSLNAGGILVFPLTHSKVINSGGFGRMIKVVRKDDSYFAEVISPAGFYPCIGARKASENKALGKALKKSRLERIHTLNIGKHVQTVNCWFHTEDFCFST